MSDSAKWASMENLPPEALAYIERIARRASWRPGVRAEIRRELRDHFEDALEGVPAERHVETIRDLVAGFGDAEVLAALIHRGKQRCRPAWEQALWMTVKTAAVLAMLFVAISWCAGRISENEYLETIAQYRKEGSMRDVTRLVSPRPAGTVYFAGPDEETPIGILRSLTGGAEIRDAVANAAENLPDIDRAEEPSLRALLAQRQDELARLRHAAGLPPIPMEQLVRITKIGAPPVEEDTSIYAMDWIRLMLVNAYFLHRDGDDDAALEECGRAHALANHIRDIPTIVSQIIAFAMEKEMAALLAPVALAPTLSSDASAAFAADWDPHLCREALAQAVELETGTSQSLIHNSPLPVTALIGGDPHWNWAQWALAYGYRNTMFRAISAKEELRYYTERIQCASGVRQPRYSPWAVPRPQRPSPRERAALHLRVLPSGSALFAGVSEEIAFAEVRMQQTRIALALNRFLQKRGVYPETLQELVPEFLSAIPGDPFSEKGFRYALQEKAYTLYSVGPDGYDDTEPHNAPAVPNNAVPEPFFTGDIVWGVKTLQG